MTTQKCQAATSEEYCAAGLKLYKYMRNRKPWHLSAEDDRPPGCDHISSLPVNTDYCYDPADRHDFTKELKADSRAFRRAHMRGYFECQDKFSKSPTKPEKYTDSKGRRRTRGVDATDAVDSWTGDQVEMLWKYNPGRSRRGHTAYPGDNIGKNYTSKNYKTKHGIQSKDIKNYDFAYSPADRKHRRVWAGVDDSFRFKCRDKKSGSTRNKEAVDAFMTKSLETLAMFNPKLGLAAAIWHTIRGDWDGLYKMANKMTFGVLDGAVKGDFSFPNLGKGVLNTLKTHPATKVAKHMFVEPNFTKVLGELAATAHDMQPDHMKRLAKASGESLEYAKYIDKQILGGVPFMYNIHKKLVTGLGKFESGKYIPAFRAAENSCQMCHAVGQAVLGTIFDDSVRYAGRKACASLTTKFALKCTLLAAGNPIAKTICAGMVPVFGKVCSSTLPYAPKISENLAGTRHRVNAKMKIINKLCSGISACLDVPSELNKVCCPDKGPNQTDGKCCNSYIHKASGQCGSAYKSGAGSTSYDCRARYTGYQNKTVSGKTCQHWSSQSPHKHKYMHNMDKWMELGIGDHNFCRNPSGKKDLWCYTNDKKTTWEFCEEPEITKTISGHECKQWSSSKNPQLAAQGNNCRNPDGSKFRWCYLKEGTTGNGKDRERCSEKADLVREIAGQKMKDRAKGITACLWDDYPNGCRHFASPAANESLSGSKGAGYRGRQDTTRSGVRCLNWNSAKLADGGRNKYRMNYRKVISNGMCHGFFNLVSKSGLRQASVQERKEYNQTKMSLDECAVACDNSKTCKYFTYGRKDGFCYFTPKKEWDWWACSKSYQTNSYSGWSKGAMANGKARRVAHNKWTNKNHCVGEEKGPNGKKGAERNCNEYDTYEILHKTDDNKWDSDPAYGTIQTYKNKGLGNHNYCRNPDGSSEGIWCYTAEKTEDGQRWDYCDPLKGGGTCHKDDNGSRFKCGEQMVTETPFKYSTTGKGLEKDSPQTPDQCKEAAKAMGKTFGGTIGGTSLQGAPLGCFLNAKNDIVWFQQPHSGGFIHDYGAGGRVNISGKFRRPSNASECRKAPDSMNIQRKMCHNDLVGEPVLIAKNAKCDLSYESGGQPRPKHQVNRKCDTRWPAGSWDSCKLCEFGHIMVGADDWCCKDDENCRLGNEHYQNPLPKHTRNEVCDTRKDADKWDSCKICEYGYRKAAFNNDWCCREDENCPNGNVHWKPPLVHSRNEKCDSRTDTKKCGSSCDACLLCKYGTTKVGADHWCCRQDENCEWRESSKASREYKYRETKNGPTKYGVGNKKSPHYQNPLPDHTRNEKCDTRKAADRPDSCKICKWGYTYKWPNHWCCREDENCKMGNKYWKPPGLHTHNVHCDTRTETKKCGKTCNACVLCAYGSTKKGAHNWCCKHKENCKWRQSKSGIKHEWLDNGKKRNATGSVKNKWYKNPLPKHTRNEKCDARKAKDRPDSCKICKWGYTYKWPNHWCCKQSENCKAGNAYWKHPPKHSRNEICDTRVNASLCSGPASSCKACSLCKYGKRYKWPNHWCCKYGENCSSGNPYYKSPVWSSCYSHDSCSRGGRDKCIKNQCSGWDRKYSGSWSKCSSGPWYRWGKADKYKGLCVGKR